MRQYIKDSYNGVMNAKYNPLRHISDPDTRNVIMLALMCMWCVIFAVWTGAMILLPASIFFHALLLFGLLVTVGTFELAKKQKTK